MLHIVEVAILAAISLPFQAAPAPQPSLERLSWLAGCWVQQRPSGTVEEYWMKPAGGTMLGMGRTVRDGKTIEYEFVQIREVDGKLTYVAKPSGQAEATFPIKTFSDSEVVFENPTHDFPQRVIYRRTADGSVHGRVEGTVKGQTRGVDFPYSRCQ
jgi:hypothetical protein